MNLFKTNLQIETKAWKLEWPKCKCF